MLIRDGWLDAALPLPCPNFDERPEQEISLIVIHGISLPAGHFGGDYVLDLFQQTLSTDRHPDLCDLNGVRVSSHLLIRRDGQIIQFVPFDKRAWHAGVSAFRGREACNDFSVGIELEGTDTCPYSRLQYTQLAAICRLMTSSWNISADRIVGHCDIAPGRKTDPGISFDWPGFRAAMRETDTTQKLTP